MRAHGLVVGVMGFGRAFRVLRLGERAPFARHQDAAVIVVEVGRVCGKGNDVGRKPLGNVGIKKITVRADGTGPALGHGARALIATQVVFCCGVRTRGAAYTGLCGVGSEPSRV